MKKILILTVVGLSLFSCKAQTKIDSISLASRERADIILKSFESENASERLVYSLDDKDFFIILKNGIDYKQYYASLMQGTVQDKRLLKTKMKDIKLLTDAFELDNYHSDFITEIPEAKYVRGKKSYFVIIDSQGKRYGEYSLASLTLPLPINSDLAGYLMRNLSEEASKN